MKEIKKIVLIAASASSHIHFRMPIIKLLNSRNIKVFALASDYDVHSRKKILDTGSIPIDIQIARTGMNPFVDLRDTIRLIKVLKTIKPDIVIGSFIKPVIFGTIAAWLAGVPKRIAMVEGLGIIYTDNGERYSYKKKFLKYLVSHLYRFALTRANTVIFLNPDDLNEFINMDIVNSDKAVVLGGIGVDLNEFSYKPPIIEPLRFIFVGRLLKEKGIMEFVSAARIVKENYENVEFVVLGGLDSHKRAIKEKEIQGWVNEGLLTWPGHVQVKPWLEKSSVFVLPSYREGVPVSTQEALSIGRPIITTDVPGCRQTVKHGVNGFLVPVRDSVQLAKRMIQLIEQPDLILSMGKRSRDLAEEKFDENKVNERLMKIIQL